MRDIKAIIPKTVAVVDGDSRVVSLIDLMDLIDEVAEAAEARRGDKGDKGEKGDIGPAGKDGKDGRDGINGKDGQPGRDGKDGAPGKDGLNGLDGKPGRDGKDGLNGLPPEHEIDPVKPAIRFKNPDGSWGPWVVPPAGKNGRGGGGSSWLGNAEFEARVRAIAAEAGGGVAGARTLFIQNDAPSVTAGTPYLWIETGLGAGGSDITFWVEDGT